MPPTGFKRKQGDRSHSGDDVSRPSPHRPEDLRLAQPQPSPTTGRTSSPHDNRARGGRNPSRGGRGGASAPNRANTPAEPATPSAAPTPAPTEQPAAAPVVRKREDPEVDYVSLVSVPYLYSIVTDDLCTQWEEQGKDAVASQLRAAVSAPDEVQASLIIHELVYSVLAGRLAPTSVGQLVADVADEASGEEPKEIDDLRESVTAVVSIICEDLKAFPAQQLKEFMLAVRFDHNTLRHELDDKISEKLGLIRDSYSRNSVRKQTNIVYRQANFNLLREESEGFAKLITEVFTSSISEEASADNVDEAVEKVKALIGAFDLDVGRSLDVILDVFGSVLVKSHRFIVKFLRASPWWPRQIGDAAKDPAGLPPWALPDADDWSLSEEQERAIAEHNQDRDAKFWQEAKTIGIEAFCRLGLPETDRGQPHPEYDDDDFAKKWLNGTGTRPPSGNKDAAQLLGFKLRFYSSPLARDETDILPDNLMYLSALLIKIGFISLKDLYSHLWRDDDDMEELRTQKEKEKEERDRAARPGAGAKNALLMAGALPDDTVPASAARLREAPTRAGTPSKEAEAEKVAKEPTTEPAEQKVALLKALLAIGALPEALFILGRFPWVLNLYPDLPEYIFRILHHSLGPVSEDVRPLKNISSLSDAKPVYETDIPGVPKGQVKLSNNPERKLLRWAQLDKADSSDGNSYRYYWDEWNDIIPVCHSVDDAFTLFDTLLPLVGVKIGHDPLLVAKIARIGKHSLKEDSTDSNRDRWLDLCKRVLLPSVSLSKANAGVVNEVFELLMFYPTKTRYLLYHEWREGRTSRNPDIKVAADLAMAETKDILKRISKTNVRPMARALAKVAYANPHIVTTVALSQVEAYDSIAAAFVEGSRYFTDLGYDVLTCNIVGTIGKAGRNTIQENGLNVSKWLNALSRFAGDIYRKYNMMKPAPVLQYVAHQLDRGDTTVLKMLESIVTSMGGITNDSSYNEAQLQAMGGGPLLQAQTILQLLDQRHEKSVQLTAKRLMSSLHATGLIGKFLVGMAQQRQACAFKKPKADEADMPLKVIGNTYDEIQRIFVQYLDLLQHNMSIDAFAAAIPNVVSLISEYELPPEIAFWICRGVIAKNIAEEKDKHDDAASSAPPETNGDVDMKDDANDSSEEDGEAVEDEPEINAATPTADDILNVSSEADIVDIPMNGDESPWHPVLDGIMNQLAPKVAPEILETIGIGFYVTFWQLSLYDIVIPRKAYQEEMARHRKKRDAVKADRSSLSASASRKKEEQLQSMNKLIDDLLNENGQHLKAHMACRKRLIAEKTQWFNTQNANSPVLHTALMEYCFLPRILTSPIDAYFSFAFIKHLHAIATPNFRTISIYDLILQIDRLVALIFMCTSKEAENFGRFLNELLKDVNRWQKARAVYEKEAWGSKKELLGFATKVEGGKPVTLLPYENFRKLAYKWHMYIQRALLSCLKSSEYMHIRNAISVLQVMLEGGVFPVVNAMGVNLQTAIDKLRSSEMQDLVTASTSLLSLLRRREKSWISPNSFCPGVQKEATPAPAPKESTGTGTPKAATAVEGQVKSAAGTSTPKIPTQPSERKPTSDKETPRGQLPSRPPVNGASAVRDREERSSSRPGRLEPSRAMPRKPSPPPRPQSAANLPSRPDSVDPRNGHRDSGRPRLPEAARSAHPRDPRDPRDAHNAREARDPRAYRGPEPSYEDYDRPPRRSERPDVPIPGRDDRAGYGREPEGPRRHERPRDLERERVPGRDRPSRPSSRERDAHDRLTRGPSSRAHHEDTPTQPSSAAAPRPGSSQSDSVNPQRARMMGLDSPTPGAPRDAAADQNQRASRHPSPRRDEDRRGPRSDRDGRGPPPDRQGPPSSGPPVRSEYSARHPRDGRPPYNNQSVDMEHGRLEQDPSQRPPARSDRNNEPEVPSGPRGRGAMSAPRGRGGPPLNTQIPPSDRSAPPTGPAGRHSRGPSAADNASAPSTPDTGGVHPSRLAHLASPTEPSRPNIQPPSGPAGGRNTAPAHAPSGPSPSTRNPPAGPAASGDGMGRGSRTSRNQMTAVNNTLAQAAHPSSGRGGRGGRQSSVSYGNHSAPPAPGPERPSSRADNYGQKDLFSSHENPNDTPIGQRPNPTRQESTRERRGPEGGERGEDRRSSRRHDESRSDRDSRDRPDRESSRRDERPRRDEGGHGDDRGSSRSFRGGNNGPPPRDDIMNPRKHPRDDGGPGGQYPGGAGRGGGGPGSRNASESKRPRRGP